MTFGFAAHAYACVCLPHAACVAASLLRRPCGFHESAETMYYHYVFSGLHAANATADFASGVYTNVAQFSGSMGTPDTWCVRACVPACLRACVCVCVCVCWLCVCESLACVSAGMVDTHQAARQLTSTVFFGFCGSHQVRELPDRCLPCYPRYHVCEGAAKQDAQLRQRCVVVE